MTSRDNAGGNASGGRNLQKEWQQSKQNVAGADNNLDDETVERETNRHDNDHDSADTAELWKLIHAQQEEIKKKDEQLDRYFTGQQEMMQTLGRLMEQDNLLLARSQEATIGSSEKPVNVEREPEVEVIEVKAETQKAAAKKAKKGTGKSKKNQTKSTAKATSSKSNTTTKKQSEPKRWWGLFSN